MKNKRTVALLIVLALVASVAFAQAKRPRPEPPPAAPQPAPTATDETTLDAAPVDARPVAEGSPAAETSSTAEARDWRLVTTTGVAAVIFLLAVAAFVQQMRRMTATILAALPRGDEGRHDRERLLKELALVRNDMQEQIASLRVAVEGIPARVQQRVQNAPPPHKTPPPPARPYEPYDAPRPVEDATAQLLTIANQIVQQTPSTLEAFRASTRQLPVRVSAWPSAADGAPVAFIVEHRDSCYAIPNVIKPARLPQEWFNRSEFGVNDEIQRVVTLPRLRRRGNEYEVTVPGVFAR
jgi:hypothetical protein